MILPDMGTYAPYIWASYGVAAVVLLWLWITASNALRHSQARLKQLQSMLAPATEKHGE